MNYYFDNNNRYQIIFPYTSDKIYVEKDISYGAFKCYQELKDRNIKTYIFMVHDIDAGTIYYFNIPKNKHLQDITQNNDEIITKSNKLEIMLGSPDRKLLQNQPNIENKNSFPTQLPQNENITMNILPNHEIQSKHENIPTVFEYNQITQLKQNDIITRLNHVEYQLEVMRKNIIQKPKEDDEGCIIF
jgi:hypothetical protein